MTQDERQEILFQLAKELLQASGKTSKNLKALAKLVESKPEDEKIDWKTVTHTCPKCNFRGAVIPHFGTRIVRGRVWRQSWCANCRASTNYHAKERVKGVQSKRGAKR